MNREESIKQLVRKYTDQVDYDLIIKVFNQEDEKLSDAFLKNWSRCRELRTIYESVEDWLLTYITTNRKKQVTLITKLLRDRDNNIYSCRVEDFPYTEKYCGHNGCVQLKGGYMMFLTTGRWCHKSRMKYYHADSFKSFLKKYYFPSTGFKEVYKW